jgi:very-short-patch-repair endonuclease
MRHEMCQTGELDRRCEGVYRISGLPSSWEADLLEVCWAQSPQGWVSHRSAARLWGSSDFNDRVLDVLVSRHLRRPRAKARFRLHESKLLDPIDMTVLRNIPVTSPARTVADVAAVVSEERLEYLVETMQRLRRCTIADIEEAALRLAVPGRRGRKKLRMVLARQGGRARSVDSATNFRMRTLVVQAGFGEPMMEFWIEADSGSYFADLAYPDDRLLIECVSVTWHLRNESYDRDSARRNELIGKGWRVLEFTWNQVFNDADAVVAAVRRAIRAPRYR